MTEKKDYKTYLSWRFKEEIKEICENNEKSNFLNKYALIEYGIKEDEKSLIKKSSRKRGFNNPLYNRVVFYYVMTNIFGFVGTDVCKILGINHATGLHYKNIKFPELITYNTKETIEISKRMAQDFIIELIEQNFKNLQNG